MWRARCSLLVAALVVSGCGRAASEKPAAVDRQLSADAPVVEIAPDEAVRILARGLEERRPEAFWNALPASYQADLNSLVRDAAGRIDPDVHRRTIAVARKAAGVLRGKRELFLASPLFQNKALPSDELDTSWDGLVGLADTVLASDLADPDRMRSFDGGGFLTETGGRLIGQLSELSQLAPGDPLNERMRERFSALSVKVISRDGDHAELEIDTGEIDGLPQRKAYLRVEGKWIPREWAENWARTINRSKERLRAALETSPASKESTLELLARAERVLDELAIADDQQSFDRILSEKIVGPAVAAMAARESSGSSPAAPAKPSGDTVVVIVRPALDAEGEESWQEKLGTIADRPDFGLAIPSRTGDATTFLVSPVGDVAAFGKRIDFAQPVSIDAEGRRITLQRMPD